MQIRHSSFFVLAFTCTLALAQATTFDRFTAELSRQLETNAISALARGMTIEFSKRVCARVGGDAANEMDQQSAAWAKKNDNFIKAAGAAVNEIGNRFLPQGGEQAKQSYFRMLLVQMTKLSNDRVSNMFGGATLDNKIVPSPQQCTKFAELLNSAEFDFKNTPEDVRELTGYMQHKDAASKK